MSGGALDFLDRLVDALSYQRRGRRTAELSPPTGLADQFVRVLGGTPATVTDDYSVRVSHGMDAVTGLQGRGRFLAAIENAVRNAGPGEAVAVLQLDVAGLRRLNNNHGHEAGDRLLAQMARRLREHAPSAARLGRVGASEFGVVVQAENVEAAALLATRLRDDLGDPMPFATFTLAVDVAVGVAVYPDHGSDADLLLQRADLATYRAKEKPAAIQLFATGLDSRSAERSARTDILGWDFDVDDLEIIFQPQVSLRDRRVVGVECLARSSVHGAVTPEDIMAVAGHTAQLGRLTEAVLREGLRRCRQWADAGRPLSVAVNLPRRWLSGLELDLPALTAELLDAYSVPPERLTLEIPEDDLPVEMSILLRLREIGVRLAVDGFGSGYSSLSYLRRLPVHEVKIDQTFVQGTVADADDLAIVRVTVDLAHHLGLTVVAQGVDSELVLDRLEEIGCDVGQGLLFSRPLPYERLETWFGARTETVPTQQDGVHHLRVTTSV